MTKIGYKIPSFILLFCLVNVLSAQKDSIVSFDKDGKPTEYALFRNGFWVQKKADNNYTTVLSRDGQTRQDTLEEWKFIYPQNYERPIGAIDTLFIGEDWNKKNNVTTVTRQDEYTSVYLAENSKNIVKDFSTDWSYVETHTKSYTNKIYYYKYRPDSICESYFPETQRKEIYHFHHQGAKKWSVATYLRDTLQTFTEIDDNIPYWHFVEYFQNGQKKREIFAHKDSIPILTTWKENGKKAKTVQTWNYDMFGHQIYNTENKPFLLKVFPYYSGLYMRFFSQNLKKQKKSKGEIITNYQEEENNDEWSIFDDSLDITVTVDSVDKKAERKANRTWKKEHIFLKIYQFQQGKYKQKALCFYRNGQINMQYDVYHDFEDKVESINVTNHLLILPNPKYEKKPKQNVPLIPIDNLANDEEYKMSMYKSNGMLYNIRCEAEYNQNYTLYTLHSKRYLLRALEGMGKPLPLPVLGMYLGMNIDRYNDLLMINHQIEASSLGCMGEETPPRWIKIVKNMDITAEKKYFQQDACQYSGRIDYLYDCYGKQQSDFIQAKWAALRQKDTTLSQYMSIFVRLHYRENKLKKVVFLSTIDDGPVVVGLKKDRNRNEKEKKYLKQILFQMPSYIIPQAGIKRRISYVYRVSI